MFKNAILLLFILFTSAHGIAQIVNIESKRMQTDTIRFAFRGDLSSSYDNNNGNYIFQFSSNISTQLKSKYLKKTYFLIGNYKVINANEKSLIHSSLVHFRFNYQLSEMFSSELFTQNQQNGLLDVNNRNLIGVGMRMNLVSKEKLKLHFGSSYMYEIEKNYDLNIEYQNHRNSTYLSLSGVLIKDKLEIINTLYYQPVFTSLDDYNIFEQCKIDLSLNKHISFFMIYSYAYDSQTPLNREQFTHDLNFGIGLKF